MKGLSMNVFRSLTIMLLTIIAYMLIDSFISIPYLAILLSLGSGFIIILAAKDLTKSELNMFRASLGMGVGFFVIGNYFMLTKIDLYYQDPAIMYIITMGFLLSAIGLIIMLSSIPVIIYNDLKEHSRRKTVAASTSQGRT